MDPQPLSGHGKLPRRTPEGGATSRGWLSTSRRYDPAKRSWAERGQLPPRGWNAGAARDARNLSSLLRSTLILALDLIPTTCVRRYFLNLGHRAELRSFISGHTHGRRRASASPSCNGPVGGIRCYRSCQWEGATAFADMTGWIHPDQERYPDWIAPPPIITLESDAAAVNLRPAARDQLLRRPGLAA